MHIHVHAYFCIHVPRWNNDLIYKWVFIMDLQATVGITKKNGVPISR